MDAHVNRALSAAVLRLLRPLVRVFLRNGVTYRDFAELAKWVFVDVATREFGFPARKQSVSRVSVLTGLSRKEVARTQQIHAPDDSVAGQQYHRAARVIAGWLRDPRFLDARGQPAALPLDGPEAGFGALVRGYSGDVPARAMLDELLRVQAVAVQEDGRVKLVARAYVPRTGEADKLHILGTDVADLIATVDHNLQRGHAEPYFQRKVAYDNLPAEAIPEFRALTGVRAQALLEDLDRWLARHDRDENPEVQGSGRKRAGVGVYYFEADAPEEG